MPSTRQPNSPRVALHGLSIARVLYDLIADEIALGSGLDADAFWRQLAAIVDELAPKNRALLDKRDALQRKIDAWHRAHPGPSSLPAYKKFLTEIGYLTADTDAPAAQTAQTANVDAEIARIAGPQLVVPVDNARYALNAANARWGSLYDALYGSDVIPDAAGRERGAQYNPARGRSVIKYVQDFLDAAVPLANGRYAEAEYVQTRDGQLNVRLRDGRNTGLRTRECYAGFAGTADAPTAILLRHNDLHIELRLTGGEPTDRGNWANIRDVRLESAVTVIMDCEDSVAAVDAEDKTRVYRNWHGLMRGDLTASVEKNGKIINRALRPDMEYSDPNGAPQALRGRALMFIRHVGMHMYTDAVQYHGRDIPETFLDAMVTALSAKLDLHGAGKFRNSRRGSVYIVKPKMHGAEEVAAANELFAYVERALDLEPNTLKLGIMDEERRTTLNLRACIGAAHRRVVFINTGFLDRTGDEIHTCMEAGAVLPKNKMKTATWLRAYEDWNVAVGLAAGLAGRAQIGKGMWAAPDNMAKMMEEKIAQPRAGANTAWVPSPTAATLHALHYHQVNARARQHELAATPPAGEADLLTIPLLPEADRRALTETEIARELAGNAQSILGYVVRWVNHGVGCSKVPDLNNTELMEDRATLRIASQHIANWLHHGLISESQVRETFRGMAAVVDRQNAAAADYQNMAPQCDGAAFSAALELVFTGRAAANGYTETVLHRHRRAVKAAAQ